MNSRLPERVLTGSLTEGEPRTERSNCDGGGTFTAPHRRASTRAEDRSLLAV